MSEEKTPEELRKNATYLRNAAESQRADILSGNYPKKLGRSYFEANVDRLEREADELEAEADRLERG